MSKKRIVLVEQEERIKRRFCLEVPADWDDDTVQEQFFEQDIGATSFDREEYAVNLDIKPLDSCPDGVAPIEMGDDG